MSDATPADVASAQSVGSGDSMTSLLDQVFTRETGMAALTVLAVLLGAWIIGSLVAAALKRVLDRSERAKSELLKRFAVTWTRRAFVAIGLIMGLESIGIATAPLIAGLGVFGFIAGFALQGTLSNFASGLMLLIYRPFDVGDVIDVGGTVGKVTELSIVSTTLTTPDNRYVIVPNGQVWGSTITNITRNPTRRVDMSMSVSYDADLDKVIELLKTHVSAQDEVLAEPEVQVEVMTCGESSVDLVVRPWSKTEDYWTLYFKLQRTMKQLMDANEIEIPFPQRVVHLVNAETAPPQGL